MNAVMTDAELLAGFRAATLAGDRFGHAEHVRVAWLYLRGDRLGRAIDAFTGDLRRFAAAHGAPQKYHETMTWAYLLLVHDRMARTPDAADSGAFVAANGDLVTRGPALLAAWYGPGTLESGAGREVFVLPRAAPALRRPPSRPARSRR